MGDTPVPVADEVTVDVDADNTVTVDGPKGQLALDVDPDLTVEVNDNEVVLHRASDARDERLRRALWDESAELVGVDPDWPRTEREI